MKRDPPSYHGYRFPPEIISYAVRLYHRFCMSFRDVEDLLAIRRRFAASYHPLSSAIIWIMTRRISALTRKMREHGAQPRSLAFYLRNLKEGTARKSLISHADGF